MKFKKPQDYEVIRPSPAAEAPPPTIQVQEVHQWECVSCATRATVLHKGTGYCRKHYDERAWGGNLIN
jgi:hypothetical protein